MNEDAIIDRALNLLQEFLQYDASLQEFWKEASATNAVVSEETWDEQEKCFEDFYQRMTDHIVELMRGFYIADLVDDTGRRDHLGRIIQVCADPFPDLQPRVKALMAERVEEYRTGVWRTLSVGSWALHKARKVH